jgi:hypothetical protein
MKKALGEGFFYSVEKKVKHQMCDVKQRQAEFLPLLSLKGFSSVTGKVVQEKKCPVSRRLPHV